MHLRIYTHLYMFIHIYMFVCVHNVSSSYICAQVTAHSYDITHTHTYTHTHTHTHTQLVMSMRALFILSINSALGPLLVILSKMVTDIKNFIILLLALILGFSLAFWLIGMNVCVCVFVYACVCVCVCVFVCDACMFCVRVCKRKQK